MGGGPVMFDDVPDYVRNQHYIKYPLHVRPKTDEEKKAAPAPAPSTTPKPGFERDRPDHDKAGKIPTTSEVDGSNRKGLMNAVRNYKWDLAWIDCHDLGFPTGRCGEPVEKRKASSGAGSTTPPNEPPKPTTPTTLKK